jgi:hypothetical protein
MSGFILLLLLFQNLIDINSNSSGNNTIKNENAGYDNRFEHKNDFDIEKSNSINANIIRKQLLGKLLDTNVSIHEKQNVLDECYQYLDVNTVREKSEMIDIPLKIKQSYENGTDGFESVSEITGIAIPSYYGFLMKGKMSIFPERSSRCLIQLDEEDMEPSDNIEDSIKLSSITPEQLLYLATKWSSKMTGLLYKFYQITSYT